MTQSSAKSTKPTRASPSRQKEEGKICTILRHAATSHETVATTPSTYTHLPRTQLGAEQATSLRVRRRCCPRRDGPSRVVTHALMPAAGSSRRREPGNRGWPSRPPHVGFTWPTMPEGALWTIDQLPMCHIVLGSFGQPGSGCDSKKCHRKCHKLLPGPLFAAAKSGF